jgi:deazaflavin-dependent oxidoreductase (nitroreductase family)
MSQSQPSTPPRQMKWMLDLQTFLLKRNWMGPAGNVLMVITTTGRKSGKKYSTPIGYVRDKEVYYGFNLGGTSNWYKNALANPRVTLTIKGKPIEARVEPVTTDEELLHVLNVYKREVPNQLQRFFGVSPQAAGAELLKAKERAVFVRFLPL